MSDKWGLLTCHFLVLNSSPSKSIFTQQILTILAPERSVDIQLYLYHIIFINPPLVLQMMKDCFPSEKIPATLSPSSGRGGVGVNNADMAHSDVVSQVIGDVGGGTDPVTRHGGPAEVASGAGSPFDCGRQAPTSSVADQWQGRQGAVLSEQATKIMEEARRQGTRKAYRHPWEEWVGWCEFRQEDPVQAPVELVANFLTEKFHTGLAYRTMNVYRSAISAKHSRVQGLPVGQNMLIVKLLKGMFNEKPPQPKYMETWNAATVLERMKTQPEDEFLSLRDLSLKVCMLMALTSASRASELHKLKISMMLDKGDEMEFHIGGLTKGRKVGDGPLVIRFVQYEAEPKLNVVHCLRTYLDTTEELRAAGTAGEQHLISFKQPHGALAKSSVARWLKIAMQKPALIHQCFRLTLLEPRQRPGQKTWVCQFSKSQKGLTGKEQ